MKSAINIGQQFRRNFRYGVGVGQVAHSAFAVPSVIKAQIIQQPSGFGCGHRYGTPAPITDPFVLSAKNLKASARQTQEVTTERVPRLRSSLAPLEINLVSDLHSRYASSVDSVFVIRRQTNYYVHVLPSFAFGVSCASTSDGKPVPHPQSRRPAERACLHKFRDAAVENFPAAMAEIYDRLRRKNGAFSLMLNPELESSANERPANPMHREATMVVDFPSFDAWLGELRANAGSQYVWALNRISPHILETFWREGCAPTLNAIIQHCESASLLGRKGSGLQ